MSYLLNFAYLLILVLASPYLIWARLVQGKYRTGWSDKVWGRVPVRSSRNRCVWLHAVSVGEVNLLAPLIQRWENLHPDWEVVISTTTQTGYDLAQKRYAPRTVFYCPLDFSWSVRNALRRMRPDLLVLAELELWPNLIAAAKEQGAKVAIINGRLGEKSFRGYSRVKWLVRHVLTQLDLVAVQNQEYAERFLALGTPAAVVHSTGSVKFDQAQTERGNPATVRLAKLAGFLPSDIIFLAGSTQAPEEALAIQTFRQLLPQYPNLRLVLVPRHPERFEEVVRLLEGQGFPFQRRSRLEQPDQAEATKTARILLVDVVGELGAWWGTAQIAFVGGSLGRRGGQNMIEPAAYGAAVSFGPNTWNFRDVVALLLNREAAVVVPDGAALTGFVARCLAQPAFASALGEKAQKLVQEQLGAADRTIALLNQLVLEAATPRKSVA